MTRTGSLAGFSVVVTRASDQVDSLATALSLRGALVVGLPVISIVEPSDGGAALARAVDAALANGSTNDWLVVTSSNGASRVADRLAGRELPVRIAAIGPKSAAPLLNAGHVVDLLPARTIAEGLLEDFPAPPVKGAKVLLAQAEVSREVLPDGLRAAGWAVEVVTAYRNLQPEVDSEVLAEAKVSDLVTFTAESTVQRFRALVGDDGPQAAACIGPVCAAAARNAGYEVVEADRQSLDGLVVAVERWATNVD